MNIKKTPLEGCLIIENKIFKDDRGYFQETFHHQTYDFLPINTKFVQDNLSYSHKNVLRGIHGDNKTWKLVSCLQGKIYLIVVNNDKKSKDYRKWISIILSEKNYKQVLIPPKHGNAYVALTKQVIYNYKQSTYYDRDSQFTINWKDPKYKFKWPVKKPILSLRDNVTN